MKTARQWIKVLADEYSAQAYVEGSRTLPKTRVSTHDICDIQKDTLCTIADNVRAFSNDVTKPEEQRVVAVYIADMIERMEKKLR